MLMCDKNNCLHSPKKKASCFQNKNEPIRSTRPYIIEILIQKLYINFLNNSDNNSKSTERKEKGAEGGKRYQELSISSLGSHAGWRRQEQANRISRQDGLNGARRPDNAAASAAASYRQIYWSPR